MNIVVESSILWYFGALFAGFIAGIGCYQAIIQIARLKVITRTEYKALKLLGNEELKNAEKIDFSLSRNEESVLRELVKESNGIGDGVAVYPFESNLRKLQIPMEEAKTAIASLQRHGLVELSEDKGYDNHEKRESMYPVYRVTARGFLWVIERNR